MLYQKQAPQEGLQNVVKNFWMIDSLDEINIEKEKIIPDGYPEMIFHYGDCYRTNISGKWVVQQKDLLAGQITNFFFLQNTGKKKMFAIKFQPWSITELFGLDMSALTNKVIGLDGALRKKVLPIKVVAISDAPFDEKIQAVSDLITSFEVKPPLQEQGRAAVKLIIKSHGELPLKIIQDQIGISERSLERYCKRYIGLSPKFYSRVIRFSHIFSLANNPSFNWTDITYIKGFYDQSHFIKNFKEFTGEEPSKYGFGEENMANFFLNP